MKAITVADAPILIPNLEHKNFTDSGEVIEENTIVNGNAKNIEGLRKGKPFTYKLFVTDKNQLIHLNKIKTMETTEKSLFFSEKLGFFTVIFGKNGLKIVLVIYFTIAQLHVIYRARPLETKVDADNFGADDIPFDGVNQLIVQVHLPYPAVRLYPNLHVLAKIYPKDG